MTTQIQAAKNGQTTEQIRQVAQAENVPEQDLRRAVAEGKVVIPANRKHIAGNLVPAGIGRMLRTKINANIGASSVRSTIAQEKEKMHSAIEAGADAVMDLSTGKNLDEIRQQLLEQCTVPFGTVPIYQVIEGRDVEDIDCDTILDVIRRQAEQGVDFFTIHAGILKEHLELINERVAGIVSRGGALLAKWMLHYNRQNPLYEMFDELCSIMAEYDVSFSLGDGLRPGCIADTTDQAQIAELKTLGELVQRARENGCQVIVEGPGHVPFDQIQYNMEIEQKLCDDAPFYVLGPIVTDIAPGYDHITSAIGGTAAAYYGASFLCYVTPREHLGLPDAEDVRAGVIASKIAAHAADVARGLPGADERDRRISRARSELNWQQHLAEALDEKKARAMHEQACNEKEQDGADTADYCTMCGREWCSVRINRQLRQAAKSARK